MGKIGGSLWVKNLLLKTRAPPGGLGWRLFLGVWGWWGVLVKRVAGGVRPGGGGEFVVVGRAQH